MRGLDVCAAFGLIGEKKWDVSEYHFGPLAAELSQEDREIVAKLNHVADGELCGTGMMFCLYNQCMKEDSQANLLLFYEAIFYAVQTISYDEFRHGLVLKELNCAIQGQPSFVQNISAEDVVKDYLLVNCVWKDPYEVLVGLTVGEITNIILYREAAKKTKHPGLKEILFNISKDEYKHKTAWRAICRKLVQQSKECRSHFIAAFRRAHFVHQAEVGRHYAAGFRDTVDFFQPGIVSEIYREKLLLLQEIVGDDIGFDPNELMTAQVEHSGAVLHKSQS